MKYRAGWRHISGAAGATVALPYLAAREWLFAEMLRSRERWAVTTQFPDALERYDEWVLTLRSRAGAVGGTIPQSYVSVWVAEVK